MKQAIKLKVNETIYDVLIEPYWTLLRVLREGLGLMGTKCGCESGECGVCSVIMDGDLVNSCLVLAIDVKEREVTTIEGIAKDGLALMVIFQVS